MNIPPDIYKDPDFFLILSFGFLVVMILMTVLWIISIFIKNVSIVDIFWGSGFIILSCVYFLKSRGLYERKFLVLILVILWGGRLTIHLFLRNRGKGEDFRYKNFRKRFGQNSYSLISFFHVFLLQALLMTLVSMPLLGAMYKLPVKSLSIWDIIAFIFWITGIIFESVGDYQLSKFRKNNDSGALLREGLWKYTRHPNYFGDFMVWTGFGMFSIAAGSYFPVAGSIIMAFLLMKVSGVTMLDRSLKQKKKGYADYINTTNSFFPWFPKNDE